MRNIIKILLVVFFSLIIFSCESNVQNTSESISKDSTLSVENNETQLVNNYLENQSKEEEKKDIVKVNDETKTSKQEEKKEIISKEKQNIKQEATNTKLKKEDMDYVVSFINVDEDLLYRESYKYGSIPSYHGPFPTFSDYNYDYSFVGWSHKQGGSLVDFEPITGTTFFYAIYNKTEKYVAPEIAACQSTEDLWYIDDVHDEEKKECQIVGEVEVCIPYVEHFLSYTKYGYSEYGYTYKGQTTEQGTNSLGDFQVGQYYHMNSHSICPNPESHNIH